MNETVKTKIKEFLSTIDKNTSIDELVSLTLEYLLDNDIVDLTEDENGDMYEKLDNEVCEFVETVINK